MFLDSLWLTDFRSYTEAEFRPASSGITVVTGANGAGKTNLIEAVGYLATLRSLRGSPTDALVRSGAPGERAVVRANVGRGTRRLTIAAELHAGRRDRVLVNGQPLRRTRDLLGSFQVTVFSPDDLILVKGGPGGRREYLDDLLVALQPRRDALLGDLERILRQRGALLKQAAGRREVPADVLFTLDVWDAKLSETGEQLAAARSDLADRLGPLVAEAYGELAGTMTPAERVAVALSYRRSWAGTLADALAAARTDDLRRAVTTVGPHRDDLGLDVGGLPARTHASQGEQRTLALALRLAGHRLVASAVGESPVLLLDDVFSELDRGRAEALLQRLPPGQAILTTAGDLPPGGTVEARFRVEWGKILP